MRSTKWMAALFFAGLLGTGYAIAADSVQRAPASETGRLETINDAPAATAPDMKDCPVHHDKKECPMDHARQDFKHGEPCPYHQNEMHHGRLDEKCEHEQHS